MIIIVVFALVAVSVGSFFMFENLWLSAGILALAGVAYLYQVAKNGRNGRK